MVLQYINKAGYSRTVTTGASNAVNLITLILMMGYSIIEIKDIK